jgi:K+-sensing histidine kinase KdpD
VLRRLRIATHLPRREVVYRGTTVQEMHLPAVIRRAPRLCLIDELAHTNSPGLEHRKRFEDVQDVLDAGIDVFSTLNVQHLESLSASSRPRCVRPPRSASASVLGANLIVRESDDVVEATAAEIRARGTTYVLLGESPPRRGLARLREPLPQRIMRAAPRGVDVRIVAARREK